MPQAIRSPAGGPSTQVVCHPWPGGMRGFQESSRHVPTTIARKGAAESRTDGHVGLRSRWGSLRGPGMPEVGGGWLTKGSFLKSRLIYQK